MPLYLNAMKLSDLFDNFSQLFDVQWSILIYKSMLLNHFFKSVKLKYMEIGKKRKYFRVILMYNVAFLIA